MSPNTQYLIDKLLTRKTIVPERKIIAKNFGNFAKYSYIYIVTQNQ